MKKDLQCSYGLVNFDGKLFRDLVGFEKVNRLAVILVQEEENQILGMVQTEDSTDTVALSRYVVRTLNISSIYSIFPHSPNKSMVTH